MALHRLLVLISVTLDILKKITRVDKILWCIHELKHNFIEYSQA